MTPETRARLRAVPWLRVINRVTTLVRAARQDPELERDHQSDREQAAAMRRSLENATRKASGCRSPAACGCPLCMYRS